MLKPVPLEDIKRVFSDRANVVEFEVRSFSLIFLLILIYFYINKYCIASTVQFEYQDTSADAGVQAAASRWPPRRPCSCSARCGPWRARCLGWRRASAAPTSGCGEKAQ